MIPPNLRQDWLRNTGLLLLLFVALFCFLSWTLFRVVLGDEPPVLGGVEPVPNEFITPDQRIDSPENVPSSEQDIPEPNEPERVEAEGVGDGFGTPFESEAPRFAPQEQELASAFNVERSDDLGVSFVMRENWRRAVVELEEGESPERADTDLVFEAPDGSSRFAISAWDAGERVPFELWVLSVAGRHAVHRRAVPDQRARRRSPGAHRRRSGNADQPCPLRGVPRTAARTTSASRGPRTAQTPILTILPGLSSR